MEYFSVQCKVEKEKVVKFWSKQKFSNEIGFALENCVLSLTEHKNAFAPREKKNNN